MMPSTLLCSRTANPTHEKALEAKYPVYCRASWRGLGARFAPGLSLKGFFVSSITPFFFEAHEVRVIDQGGNPWFFAVDVCAALGISNSRDALEKLDNDERAQVVDPATVGLTDSTGINNLVNIVSESGLYTLVLRCRDATTPGTVPHRFRKWVTSEVLPSIRKTGGYHVGRTAVVDPVLAAHIQTLIELDQSKQRIAAVEAAQERIAHDVSDTAKRLDQIETATDYFTVIGWHRFTKKSTFLPLAEASKMGVTASRYCKENGIPLGHVPDQRFGTANTYPKWVLDALFDEAAVYA